MSPSSLRLYSPHTPLVVLLLFLHSSVVLTHLLSFVESRGVLGTYINVRPAQKRRY